jgi:hypothetical protein
MPRNVKKSCSDKVRYLNQEEALKAARGEINRAYPCRFCKGWHLTSKPEERSA